MSKQIRKLNHEEEQEVVSFFKKAIASWYSYWSDNIDKYKEDKRFYFGEQWEPSVMTDYKEARKPTLVIDKIGPFVRKMMGEQKNADLAPVIIPQNADVPEKEVALISGLMRRIMYQSNASEAFSKTNGNQLSGGWGVIKISTEYEDEKSFDQIIRLSGANEPTNCFFDPNATHASKVDGEFCGDWFIMSKDKWEATYPDIDFPRTPLLPYEMDNDYRYVNDCTILCRGFRREIESKTLIELTDDKNFKVECYKEDVAEEEQKYIAMMEKQGMDLANIPPLTQSNKRQTTKTTIRTYILSSEGVMENSIWLTKDLPYIYTDGDSEYFQGKQYTKSFIRSAMDAQRVYNYSISEAVAAIKVSRREKFFATQKQIKGYERQYRNPEQVNGALLYNPDPSVNSPGNAPVPIEQSDISQSFFALAQSADRDIINTLGMLDPITGGLPNGASGQAIGRTIVQQNLVVVNILQNLCDAQQQAGKTILELIPKIYDSNRTITILDENNQPQRIAINQKNEFGEAENDIGSIYENISDVEIKVGSSFAAQRRESLEFLMNMFQNETVGPLIADMIAGQLDLPIAPKLQERLKNVVPPAILAKENGQPPPPVPPNPQMIQAQQELQLKQQKLGIDAQALNDKRIEKAQEYAQWQKETQQKDKKDTLDYSADIFKAALDSGDNAIALKVEERGQIRKALLDLTKGMPS